MPKVTFIEADDTRREVDAVSGDSAMQAATHNGVSGIIGECGGSCICATCHCYVDEAWMASSASVIAIWHASRLRAHRMRFEFEQFGLHDPERLLSSQRPLHGVVPNSAGIGITSGSSVAFRRIAALIVSLVTSIGVPSASTLRTPTTATGALMM